MKRAALLVAASIAAASACSAPDLGGGLSGPGGSSSGGSSSGGSASSSGGSTSGGASSSSPSSSASSGGSSGGPDAGSDAATVDPPLGGSSKGTGGAAPVSGATATAQGITYRLIVPSSPAQPAPLLIVYSGVEGGGTMTNNLISLGPSTGIDGFLRAVLDGKTYRGNGQAGATVLDDVRAKYDVDNDRTYLIGESAGTTAALALGLRLRQSYFAAYWANDVNASDTPLKNAAALGFKPWGQAGPGGDLPDATAIVNGMKAAGYRVPNPAPYDGPGSTQHGNVEQFIAALTWLPGKTRQ